MKYVFAKKINDTDETGIINITKNPPELICLCDESHSILLLQALNISSKQVVSGSLPLADELWDEYSIHILDDIDSLQQVAGTTVITKPRFRKMINDLRWNLKEQKRQ